MKVVITGLQIAVDLVVEHVEEIVSVLVDYGTADQAHRQGAQNATVLVQMEIQAYLVMERQAITVETQV